MQNNFDNFFKTREKEKAIFHVHSFDIIVKKIEREVDVAQVAEKLNKIPSHMFWGIENIVIDRYEILAKRGALAVMDEKNIYVSSLVDNEEELYSSIMHEIAHRLMARFNSDIFSDKTIENEFLAKRKYLYQLLEAIYKDNNLEMSFYTRTEYNREFDDFLVSTVGYSKLSNIISGLFVSPYAVTSLEEYFARNFEEYFNFEFNGKNILTTIAPAVYNKITEIVS